ncbi:unnamed protein product, partial [Staurois parvus]
MICVAPAAPPVSVHQCQLSVLIHATPPASALQFHISATFQCPSVLPISAAYQCHLSVPPISAYMSAAFQCPSVMPVNAHQCH